MDLLEHQALQDFLVNQEPEDHEDEPDHPEPEDQPETQEMPDQWDHPEAEPDQKD